MAFMGHNERFEILAMLYERRYGEMAPGKDRPAVLAQTDAEHEINCQHWKAYTCSILALEDALEHIHRLNTDSGSPDHSGAT